MMMNAAMTRSWLASGKVRYVGEPVALIVAESRAAGVDATEAVYVDYEPLDAVIDMEKAEGGGDLLFEDAGTNVAVDMGAMFGYAPTDEFFAGCDVVVTQRIVNHRVAPCPMETRAAASSWDGDKLTHWASCQAPNTLRDGLAGALGIDATNLRLIAPDVGGGFGAKTGVYPEELLAAWAAKKLDRPVRWVETRTESMLCLGQGRGQNQRVSIGGGRDGVIGAYRIEVLQDAGAYPGMGGFLPMLTRMMAPGTYVIPKVEFGAKSFATSTVPTTAYRGAGRPEASAAIERAIDVFAAEIGMDPAEVRAKNLVPADQFPYTTATGTNYDCGDYKKALDLALSAAGYESLRKEQAARRASGDPRLMGIGLACYVEITNPLPGGEYGGVEVTPDGKAIIRAGTFSHGQGHATVFAQLVADRLGIDIDDIEFRQGDTDEIRSGQGTMGSRSLQTAGSAVAVASDELVERARDLAAQLLEANVDDIVLDKAGGRFHVAGTPTVAKTWSEVAASAGEPLRADSDFTPAGPTFPFGAHVAVVEIDRDTGKVTLDRFVAVDDSGTVFNPLITEGQRHGGIAQGVAQALMEEMVYDEDGNPLTSNLADYGMISAAELPSFELVPMETPTPLNALGAKGIGESGTIGATPAVQNAVVDALAHLGVRHVDMPLTPERVWRAIPH
jgi:carbon-monoxide dehydrogenase large subunit